MTSRTLAAIVALTCSFWVPAEAADRFGTAGSFRSVGWADCGAPVTEMMQGACDPAQPDPALTAPELARAHVARAKALVSFTRMEAALKAAGAAVDADPQNLAALTFRARLALTMLKPAIAERDLNVALMLEPRNAMLLATRAELLLDNGEARAALQDISAARELAPGDFDVLWIKARVYIALRQLNRAEEDLGHALSIEPGERGARLTRAQLRLQQGNFAGAVEDATEILRNHADPSAAEVRAVANTALDRRAEAVDDLGVIFGPPGDPTPAVTARHYHGLLMQRIILLVQLGRQDEAGKDVDTLLTNGGKQGVLRLQVYLRRNGFVDIALDGERTSALREAVKACLLNQACARGLVQQS